jgi:hypothetical protein
VNQSIDELPAVASKNHDQKQGKPAGIQGAFKLQQLDHTLVTIQDWIGFNSAT